MSRWIEQEHIGRVISNLPTEVFQTENRIELVLSAIEAIDAIKAAPSIEIIRCKECKHRPIKEDADGENYGFNVIAPNGDERCPCLVEDGWYSWIPKDDFYCGYGERKESE